MKLLAFSLICYAVLSSGIFLRFLLEAIAIHDAAVVLVIYSPQSSDNRLTCFCCERRLAERRLWSSLSFSLYCT